MNHTRTTDGAEVSIIVVTHGAREMTLACLQSITVGSEGLRTEVIVVDNASPGGLAAELASAYPDIHLFRQVTNLGFAAAANLGACEARGDYLLFVNPDTLIERDTIARLVGFARRNPRGVPLGVRTFFASGKANPMSCRRKATPWRLLCAGLGLDTRFPNSRIWSGMGYGELPEAGGFPVDVACGVCLLIERSIWDRLGGFSPAFFMYGEDEDLSLRATQIGCRPMLALDIAIVHHGSGTEPDQARKLCQLLAARSLIVRGYFPGLARPVCRALLLLRPFLGKSFARQDLRPLWQNVWAKRGQWLSGRFA